MRNDQGPASVSDAYGALGITSGAFVLDIGCGVGSDLRALAEIVGPDGLVAGIDDDTSMIQAVMLRGLPQNATISEAPVTLIPFRDGLFDAAIAGAAFARVLDPARAAREIRRVLRSGGRFMATSVAWPTVHVNGSGADAKAILEAAERDATTIETTTKNVALLSAAGFTNVRELERTDEASFEIALDRVLRPAASAAVRQGVMDEEAAQRWIETLRAADQRGAFACTYTLHSVVAATP